MSVEVEQADSATRAFTDMRDKIAGLTRAVDSMAGEWKALVIPDYSQTLEKVAMELKATADQLGQWAEKPALKLTPQALGEAIIKAGSAARADDHAALDKAIKAINQTEKDMTASLVSVRTAQAQDKRLRRVSINCLIAGMVLWAVVPGPIIRALPASWHLPERLAARTLGTDAWDGGQRLMMFANPDGWNAISLAGRILNENYKALLNCERLAQKKREAVHCDMVIKK
jgi:Family of unknown function (DUF6118)